MKDAYSFDADIEGLKASYKLMYDAYHRVFERCGLSFRPVEAQAGEICGDVNHEFMAVGPSPGLTGRPISPSTSKAMPARRA